MKKFKRLLFSSREAKDTSLDYNTGESHSNRSRSVSQAPKEISSCDNMTKSWSLPDIFKAIKTDKKWNSLMPMQKSAFQKYLEETDVDYSGSQRDVPEKVYAEMQFRKISATELANVEMVHGDQNDPYALVRVGTKWSHKTETHHEAGSAVDWLLQEINGWHVVLSKEDIDVEVLYIAVVDHNSVTKDVLIGYGQISLSEIVGENKKYGETYVDLPIFDGSKNKTGIVHILINIQRTDTGMTALVVDATDCLCSNWICKSKSKSHEAVSTEQAISPLH